MYNEFSVFLTSFGFVLNILFGSPTIFSVRGKYSLAAHVPEKNSSLFKTTKNLIDSSQWLGVVFSTIGIFLQLL